nr:YciI family protein [Rhizobium sp. Leaf341]
MRTPQPSTGRQPTIIFRKKAISMHYMLQFRETPEERRKPNDPAQVGPYWGGWQAYIGALAQSGVMIGGNVLRPPETATTVRVENGTRNVVDGPFADTKEQLAGFVVLDVPDLDTALEWAARAPCATGGSVEVRAVLPPPAS